MPVNLLNQLQDQIGDVLVSQASDLFNESQEGVQKATGVILPALLASIVQKGSSENGAKELMNRLKEGNYNGGLLDNIASIMGESSNALDDLLERGGAIVDDLTGEDKTGLTDMVANYAGTDKESTSSLLHLAAPMLMSILGKQVQNKGLNAGGLMNLLAGQKEYIKDAVPSELAGIGNLLGLSGELSNLGKVTEPPRSGGGLAWIIGIVAVLLIAALLYLFAFRNGEPAPAAEELVDTTEQAAQPADPGADLATDEGVSAEISAVLAGEGNLQGQTFSFANPEFQDDTSQPTRSLALETNNLASLLNRYPNLNIQIIVYTPDDLDLAQFRGVAIKNRLHDQGVSSERITVQGATGEDSKIEVRLNRREE